MSKSANLNIRMNPEIKEEAELILKELGITPSNAIDMFYRQIINTKGLPFDIRLPNDHPLNIENKSESEIIDLIMESLKDLEYGRVMDSDTAFKEIANRHEKLQDKINL